MRGPVIIDTNLLLLLFVGSASTEFVGKHKRTRSHLSLYDFDMLGMIIATFSDIILLPHVLTETSNLARQISNPDQRHISNRLYQYIATCIEVPISSISAAGREEFARLGLTDAAILQFCALTEGSLGATILTVDGELADAANSLGYSLIDYKRNFMSVSK